MAEPADSAPPMMRTFAAFAAVFALLYLLGSSDLLLDLTRPLVKVVLGMAGISTHDTADELIVGSMRIPWTRDCAGVNIFILLLAVAFWSNRAEPLSRRSWLQLLLAIPVALAANTCRVLTIIIYRNIFYPSVESQQLHYFIGFLWLIPCLPVFVPPSGREPFRYLLETLYLAVVLALVAPFVPAPGGVLVTLATLLLVARSRYAPLPGDLGYVMVPWVLSAGFIAVASMESLWLPWILLCPFFWEEFPRRFVQRLALAAGTIPILAMDHVGAWLIAGVVAWAGWTLFRSRPDETSGTPAGTLPALQAGILTAAFMALALLFPFVASTLSGLWKPTLCPPPGAMFRLLAPNAYDLRLVGQSPEIRLVWYGPSGDGRHHTLPVCLAYRGVQVRPSGSVVTVMTDGKNWLREFFIQRHELLPDYASYLRRTIWPWSSAGVHLIFSAPAGSIPAEQFARQAHDLALQVNGLGEPVAVQNAGPRLP